MGTPAAMVPMPLAASRRDCAELRTADWPVAGAALADAVGAGVGEEDADGAGVALAVGSAVVDGDGDGAAVAVSDGVGVGVGVAVSVAAGVGVSVGAGVAATAEPPMASRPTTRAPVTARAVAFRARRNSESEGVVKSESSRQGSVASRRTAVCRISPLRNYE